MKLRVLDKAAKLDVDKLLFNFWLKKAHEVCSVQKSYAESSVFKMVSVLSRPA